MESVRTFESQIDRVVGVLDRFTHWLEAYGENSWDHQSYFAGTLGGWAKALYYRRKMIGTFAVAPMIFSEAFLPSARRLFHKRIRFPIADAHYAMGFAFLYRTEAKPEHLKKSIHFLHELEKSRCSGFDDFCWGYDFDWVTRNGVIKRETPLITTTPYAYEAFLQMWQIDPRDEWKEVLASIARHASCDIKDFRTSEAGSTCSYTPYDKGGVVNAAAYRAALLASASRILEREDYWLQAERNISFVLEAQNPDGSWCYAIDGVRNFVDHFHTCFVMKALAKTHTLTDHAGCLEALARGVKYYLNNLFDDDGLPSPFSKAPRLTVYRRELYDCAESINLCLLLRDRFPEMGEKLETVIEGVLDDWVKPDGSFRGRKLHFGWDNVPMHRWGQSQMFRALAYYYREACGQGARLSGHHSQNTAAQLAAVNQVPGT